MVSEAGHSSSGRPSATAVILGASNAARGISTLVETAQLVCGGPVDILASIGHGRSYGMTTTVLGRKISGILPSGIWEGLNIASDVPIYALVTDIGNDLVYGVPVAQILEWVEACLDRLASCNATIVMTRLPLDSVCSLSEWQFQLVRRILFPFSQLTLQSAIASARQLDASLTTIARKREITIIPQKNNWFGFDPIHIRRRYWSSAWGEILSHWAPSGPTSKLQSRGSLLRWIYLRSLVPEQRTLFGFKQSRAQPAGKLPSGTTISLF